MQLSQDVNYILNYTSKLHLLNIQRLGVLA